MIIFFVSVIGFNVNTFRDRYEKYIKKEHETYFGNALFALEAPQNIYDEISGLEEEMIEIVK